MDTYSKTIATLSDLFETVMQQTFNQFDFSDLSRQQLLYLRVILRLHNPSVSELAKELKLTKPTVTAMVDKLESKGYIKRVKSDSDRRSMHLHLAEKGMQVNIIIEKTYDRLIKTIKSKLNDTETIILMELLKKIVRNI